MSCTLRQSPEALPISADYLGVFATEVPIGAPSLGMLQVLSRALGISSASGHLGREGSSSNHITLFSSFALKMPLLSPEKHVDFWEPVSLELIASG